MTDTASRDGLYISRCRLGEIAATPRGEKRKTQVRKLAKSKDAMLALGNILEEADAAQICFCRGNADGN